MKRCNQCGGMKPLEQFYRNPGVKDGRRPECKACTAARRKAWYRKNRDREIQRVREWQRANHEAYLEKQAGYRARGTRDHRAEHLRQKFGLTVADFDSLLRVQGGGCAICYRHPTAGTNLHIDHDHETGRVRALLCMQCNNGLGLFSEDSGRLQRAADYLDPAEPTHVITLAMQDLARRRVRELIRTVPV